MSNIKKAFEQGKAFVALSPAEIRILRRRQQQSEQLLQMGLI